ncbi:MAG: hypothetical protein ACKVII_16250 [Planctomycetales bacterium]
MPVTQHETILAVVPVWKTGKFAQRKIIFCGRTPATDSAAARRGTIPRPHLGARLQIRNAPE